jgi:dTDP-4-dehydrorhamnose reductase
MQKILVLGGSGLVGSVFANHSQQYYDLHLTYNDNPINNPKINSTKINVVTQISELKKLILDTSPDVIINTIAHSSVDLCETNHNDADFLHVNIPKKILEFSSEIGSRLIYFSTDAVFPGELNKKYNENDTPRPVNYYGETKLNAEKIILNHSQKNTVLRTAGIYGKHERSRFTNWILSSLKNNKMVDPFIDQFNTPTLVDDIAKTLIRIIDENISGLYHATGSTCLNRYDFALLLAKYSKLNSELIKPVTKNEKKQLAPRPISTCLDSSKLENILKIKFSDINSGISQIIT